MKKNVTRPPQTNGFLRKHALHLYWRQRGLLWSVFFLIAGIRYAWAAAGILVPAGNVVKGLTDLLYYILLAPLSILGVNAVLLRLFRGKPVSFSMVFDFYRDAKTLPKVLAAGTVAQFPVLLPNLVISFMGSGPVTQEQARLYLMGALAAAVLWIWLMLKLFLFSYLYIQNPGERLAPLVKASFLGIRKKAWRTVGFFLGSIWWTCVIFAAPYLFFAHLTEDFILRTTVSGELINNGMGQFLFALLMPYVQLAMAGYAARTIDGREA